MERMFPFWRLNTALFGHFGGRWDIDCRDAVMGFDSVCEGRSPICGPWVSRPRNWSATSSGWASVMSLMSTVSGRCRCEKRAACLMHSWNPLFSSSPL